jgi:hypothetical protein
MEAVEKETPEFIKGVLPTDYAKEALDKQSLANKV